MTTHDDTTGFVPENPYADEAKERWGHTDAYRQSQERTAKMTEKEWQAVREEGEDITRRLAGLAGRNPDDPEVQAQIQRHFDWLRHFYEPDLGMYRGLGTMYAEDPRFGAHYDAYEPGLAAFMRDAMHAYCDARG